MRVPILGRRDRTIVRSESLNQKSGSLFRLSLLNIRAILSTAAHTTKQERQMIDRNSVDSYTDDRGDTEELPRANEKLTGGMRVEDIWGCCPPEEFDGFNEWLREFRRQGARKEPQQ